MGFDFGIGATHDARMEKRERNREDRFRDQDRAFFESDRAHGEAREDSTLTRLVQGARDAGLHPLAALGANMTSGPMFRSSSTGGRGGGRGAGDMDFAGLMVAKAQVRNLDAETDFVREQTEASRIARTTQGMTPDKQVDIHGNELTKPTRVEGINLPFGMGKIRRPGGKSSDAETAEQAYAEGGSIPIGIANLIEDYINEVTTRFGESKGFMNMLFRRSGTSRPSSRRNWRGNR